MKEYLGKLQGCEQFNTFCNYACCNQGCDSSFSIFMYPNEYENTLLPKDHIQVIKEEKNGIKIGKCKYSIEERKMCTGIKRFKPLDCFSYPFFPVIKDYRLFLLVDKVRCPLPHYYNLNDHYCKVYNIWRDLIKNKQIYDSICQIYIDYFSEYKNFEVNAHLKN